MLHWVSDILQQSIFLNSDPKSTFFLDLPNLILFSSRKWMKALAKLRSFQGGRKVTVRRVQILVVKLKRTGYWDDLYMKEMSLFLIPNLLIFVYRSECCATANCNTAL